MAFFEQIFIKTGIIAACGEANNLVVWLVTLNKNITVLMAAIGAPDNLSEELETAFFGGEVWETEVGVGLDNTESAEFREVETLGKHLSTDNNIVGAVVYLLIDAVEFLVGGGVGVEAANLGVREEASEFVGDKFGAEALVVDASIAAFWTGGSNREVAAAGMAAELVFIGMEH